ncbi:hypothetical protein [Tepidimonas alkaliphilus]|uniref:hypothetical protein n=1 Tax=Tepidimonas alkaliphilus TaxID=2588942 RepID=UPI001C8F70B2|nr:hypothetical protein [Tepidimonas alkaliphilus]
MAALAVAADRWIGPWSQDGLVTAWLLMWAVVFFGSLVLASPARHAARRLTYALDAWARSHARARARLRAKALAQAGLAPNPTAPQPTKSVEMPAGRQFNLYYI